MKNKALFTKPLEVRLLLLQLTVYISINQARSPVYNNTNFFTESIKSSFVISFDSWVTDRTTVNTGKECQPDIGSASYINVPLYLTVAHQKPQRDIPAKP